MNDSLLATKLYIPPPRPNWVLRPRLLHRLDEGLDQGCRLTLVSAPAGYGKTALVCQWIERLGKPIGWLSIDQGDNDLARFLSYLVSAFERADKALGAGLRALLQAPQIPAAEAVLTALINRAGGLEQDMVLVLDDLHFLHARQVHDALVFLVEHLPPNVHLAQVLCNCKANRRKR